MQQAVAFPHEIRPPPVPDETLREFHTTDRALYSRLTGELRRDLAESVRVLAFLIWLERACRINLIYRMLSLPPYLLRTIAVEAARCVECVESDALPLRYRRNEIKTLSEYVNLPAEFDLRFFHENRKKIKIKVKKISDICCRAISVPNQPARRDPDGGGPSWAAENRHGEGGGEMAPPPLPIMQHNPYLNVPPPAVVGGMMHMPPPMYAPGLLVYGPLVPVIGPPPPMYEPRFPLYAPGLPVYAPIQQVYGPPYAPPQPVDARDEWVVKDAFGLPLYSLQAQGVPVYVGAEHAAAREMNGDVIRPLLMRYLNIEDEEDERTIFLTFANGYPVTEDEIRDYFTRKFGDVVVSVIMHEGMQPQYAKMVARSREVVDQIVARRSVKHYINGKYVWASRYETSPEFSHAIRELVQKYHNERNIGVRR